jgi:hypothetical protein
MILPSRSVSILFGTDANLGSATSSVHRRTLNSCCSAKDLIAKTTVLGGSQVSKRLKALPRLLRSRRLDPLRTDLSATTKFFLLIFFY